MAPPLAPMVLVTAVPSGVPAAVTSGPVSGAGERVSVLVQAEANRISKKLSHRFIFVINKMFE
jgi:hypothetical protein